LASLVNGYSDDGGEKMNRLELETKLIALKDLATEKEGLELEQIKKEINKA